MGRIVVEGVGKAYKQYPSRWARLREWLLPAKQPRHHLHWVLQDVHLQIEPGESVGIVGMNGAGKSTLLKLITGTSAPTVGRVHLQGQVAALLELGMGFHADFTGRQNVYMAGQLLGHSITLLDQLMPEIEAFAEIGDYIDQPTRVYSSGMQMRLAFSVATAVRPDILIVDEALSVGDAYFQHKSFDRIREFSKLGTTLLIVSHDKQAIQSICDRAILLKAGQVVLEDKPEVVFDYYNALLADHQNQHVRQQVLEDNRVQTISGSGEAQVEQIYLLNQESNACEVISVGQAVVLEIDVRVHADLPKLVLGFGIKDRLGQVMYGTNTALKRCELSQVHAGEKYRFRISFDARLGAGSYSIQTALVGSDTHLEHNYEWRDLALVFSVINSDQDLFEGCCWLDPEIEISAK